MLSPDIVGAIAMRVATILHASHQHGYIHRDVKPEHIFMDRADDGSLRIRLLDFGVCASARAPRDEREREQGRVFGTPSYVSPEQASGNRTSMDARHLRSRIVMFDAVTADALHRSNVANLLRASSADRPAPALRHASPSPSTRSSPLDARDSDDRFHSMRAFSRALAPLVTDRATSKHPALDACPAPRRKSSSRPPRRLRSLIAALL